MLTALACSADSDSAFLLSEIDSRIKSSFLPFDERAFFEGTSNLVKMISEKSRKKARERLEDRKA